MRLTEFFYVVRVGTSHPAYSFHIFCSSFQEQKAKVIEKLGQKAQLRRQFSNFKEGIAEQNAESANEQAADDFSYTKSLSRGMHSLQLATKRSKHMRQAFQNKAQVRILSRRVSEWCFSRLLLWFSTVEMSS